MTSNEGKFIDRSVGLRPAGKITYEIDNNVPNCLKVYNLDGLNKKQKIPFTYPLPKARNNRHEGLYTNIWPLFHCDLESDYQTILNELKETTYESFWNKSLGRTRDPTAGLPKGMDWTQVTFGNPTTSLETVQSLVNPKKSYSQVDDEFAKGHEYYCKSHNDYYPGEKVNRNYLNPPFDSNRRFGQYQFFDANGNDTRCLFKWHQNESIAASKIEVDYIKRTKYPLGKCLTPNENIKLVKEGHAFGKPPKKDACSVGETLKDWDVPSCSVKRNLGKWIKAYNKLKSIISESNFFTIDDLLLELAYYDKDKNDIIDLKDFYHVCLKHHIRLNWDDLEGFLRHLSLVKDDKIHYRKLIDFLDFRKSDDINLGKIEDVPNAKQYFITSSQAADCDYLYIDNTKCPPAGIPSRRFDLDRPVLNLPGTCNVDLEHLGDETSSRTLISPSIFSTYGLTFRDFFAPRSKDFIKTLCEKCEYKIEKNDFEKLWNMGIENDKTGMVCVDTFIKLYEKSLITDNKA